MIFPWYFLGMSWRSCSGILTARLARILVAFQACRKTAQAFGRLSDRSIIARCAQRWAPAYRQAFVPQRRRLEEAMPMH
jgi:hypothetical protein